MPNASTYIIDVANIRPGGSTTKGLYVGSTESKYALLGDKCIYDKVLYELDINNISDLEPFEQDVDLTTAVTKSQRTHGNSTAQSPNIDSLGIKPTSVHIPANYDQNNTQVTTVGVSGATGTTATGASTFITITQKADYLVNYTNYSIVGTLSDTSNISYVGGDPARYVDVTSTKIANYRSTAQYTVNETFNVTGIEGCTLTRADNGAAITNGTTGLPNGLRINVKVDRIYHDWHDKDVKFVITCDNDNTSPDATKTISWTQNHEPYNYVRTDTYTTISSDSVSVDGGTVSLTFGLQNAWIFAWESDGVEFTERYTYDGSANVSSDNAACTISPTTVSNGDTITCVVGNNYENWYGRTITIYDTDTTHYRTSGTISQGADYADYVRTDVQTEWAGETTGTVPSGGGTKTVSWWTTRYHIYKWRGSGREYVSSTDTEGTATLSIDAADCSLSRSSISNGEYVTITFGSTSSPRTVTVTPSIRSDNTISWSQDGQSLRTPEVRAIHSAYYSLAENNGTESLLPDSYNGPVELSFAAAGGSKTIYVFADNKYPWSLSVSADSTSWVHLNKTGGTGDDIFTITIDSNAATSSRDGRVTFTKNISPGQDHDCRIDIGQEAAQTVTTLTMTNSMSVDISGTWATLDLPSSYNITGHIQAGNTATYTWPSSAFPFRLTGFTGTCGDSRDSFRVQNLTNSNYFYVYKRGTGSGSYYYEGSGTINVNAGDTIKIG